MKKTLLLLILIEAAVCDSNVTSISEALTGVNPDLQLLFNETKSCVMELWAKSEVIKNRFSVREIAGLCSRKIRWQKKSESRRLRDDDSPALSKRQEAWLKQIRSCKDLFTCVCPTGVCAAELGHSRSKRQTTPLQKAVRKEIRTLSDEERRRFHDAMNRLKHDLMDGKSKYDILVYYHQPEKATAAHWGPAFLPWHRDFLRQLEVALRAYDFDVAVPYWDSQLDEGLPNPADSILWSDEFLGASDLYLLDGPYKDWETLHLILDKPRIVRNLGKSKFGSLYRPEDLQLIMAKGMFEELTSCVDPYFELVHGAVHLWVGGHMADIPISPNDPLFFIHHSYLDYIWEAWRQKRQSREQRERDYPSKEDSCNAFHYANATMNPFEKLNIDGLSNIYTDVFYEYQPSPYCSAFGGEDTCTGQYLFCDTRRNRCLSRIKVGGNCVGFENTDICMVGDCVDGTCQVAPQHVAAVFKEAKPTEFKTAFNQVMHLSPPAVPPQAPPIECDCKCPTFESLRPQFKTSKQPTFRAPLPVRKMPPPGFSQFPQPTPLDLSDVDVSHFKPDDNVWFSITVLQGMSISDPNKVIAGYAKIETVGKTYRHLGYLMNRSGYPYHKGAAYVKVLSPQHASNGRSEADIRVEILYGPSRRNGPPCQAYCRKAVGAASSDSQGYVPCSGKVTLDVNLASSDPIPYTPYPGQVMYLGWKGEEYRASDYFLFLCPLPGPEDVDQFARFSSAENGPVEEIAFDEGMVSDFGGGRSAVFRNPGQFLSNPMHEFGNLRLLPDQPLEEEVQCMFQRFPNYILVGFAELVREEVTLEECKLLCRNSVQHGIPPCASINYWNEPGNCVVNTMSRHTQPDLWVYRRQENSVYLDYVCDLATFLEH